MSAVNNRRIAALASDRLVHKAFAWLHLYEAQLRRWQMKFLGSQPLPSRKGRGRLGSANGLRRSGSQARGWMRPETRLQSCEASGE